MQISKSGLFLLLALFFASYSSLSAQCYGNPQGNSSVCSYSPITYTVNSTCGNCTHTWSSAGLVSGQGTATATFLFGSDGVTHDIEYPQAQSYDPNFSCSYYDTWELIVGRRPNYPMPTLLNGPWDGDTSKVWIYHRNRGGIMIAPNYVFTPTWSVTGGSIVQGQTVPGASFPYDYDDTLKIKWNGSLPMEIIEYRSTEHDWLLNPVAYCTWNPVSAVPSYPSLTIFNGPTCANSPNNFYTFPFPGSTYTWSVTNGSVISGQGTSSAQITLFGNGTVSVVRDSSSIQTSASKPITPTVAMVNLGPDQTICQGTSALLDAGPGFTNYLWSTGATSQSISASTPGSYAVTATINGNCAASDTILISLLPTTQPNLGADTSVCVFPVNLDAGAGYVAYAWNTGATTQTISVGAQGNYQVTVTHANGCTSTDTIGVLDDAANVDLGPDFSFCGNTNYALYPTITNVQSFNWSTGATTGAINLTGVGLQIISVSVTSTYGCIDADTVLATGLAAPAINIGPDQTVCPGAQATFNAGAGYANYFWNGGIGGATFSTATLGQVVAVVYDGNGCIGRDTAIVSNYLVSPVNLGPDINVCQTTATLDAGAGYSSYLWSNGATTQSITVNVGGQYWVNVSGAGGCSSSDTINVNYNPITANLGNDTIFCEPGGILIDPQLAGNFTYNWSTGATSPTLFVSAPGVHTIILNASNSFGCSFSDTIEVTINAAQAIHLGNDTVMCRDTFMLLDAGAGFSSYAWSTGATSQSITAASGGVYTVIGTLANGCQRRDTMMISDLIDCVFPGDVNYDGVADMTDVVALGTAIGQQGGIRTNASIAWYGQAAGNWSSTLMQGVNMKHADTDGDRFVTVNDTLAISNNFGATHTKTGSISTTGEQLRVVPMNGGVVQAGQMAYFQVVLDRANGASLDSVYGLTLHIDWPIANPAHPELQFVDFNQNWFARPGNQLSMQKSGLGAADIAITRISGQDTAGQGVVMVLAFATDSTMNPTSATTFAPTVTVSEVLGTDLAPRSLTPLVTPMTVAGANGAGDQVVRHIQIYPNPANDVLNITVEGKPADRITLVNMLGQKVFDAAGNRSETFSIDTKALPAGQYCVYLQLGNRVLVKKVVLAH